MKRPYGFAECLFEDLKTFYLGESKVKFLDIGSFSHIDAESVILADAPSQPFLIKANDIIVSDSRFITKHLGVGNVLMFHGISGLNFWKQKDNPHKDVESILFEIEKENIGVDAIFVCNPHGYRLPVFNGVARYTYFLSDIQSIISGGKNGSVYGKAHGDRVIIRGEKYGPD